MCAHLVGDFILRTASARRVPAGACRPHGSLAARIRACWTSPACAVRFPSRRHPEFPLGGMENSRLITFGPPQPARDRAPAERPAWLNEASRPCFRTSRATISTPARALPPPAAARWLSSTCPARSTALASDREIGRASRGWRGHGGPRSTDLE
jgi:hypothetical protein